MGERPLCDGKKLVASTSSEASAPCLQWTKIVVQGPPALTRRQANHHMLQPTSLYEPPSFWPLSLSVHSLWRQTAPEDCVSDDWNVLTWSNVFSCATASVPLSCPAGAVLESPFLLITWEGRRRMTRMRMTMTLTSEHSSHGKQYYEPLEALSVWSQVSGNIRRGITTSEDCHTASNDKNMKTECHLL